MTTSEDDGIDPDEAAERDLDEWLEDEDEDDDWEEWDDDLDEDDLAF